MPEIAFDHKMSDAEALMWRLEDDPHFSSTFCVATVLDRAPDFDVFKRRVWQAAQRVPRLRQRPQRAPGGLTPPSWVADDDFDIDRHVRRVQLPKPGSDRQLLDLATLICADTFDRSRPLWEFTVVEGLARRRAAVVQKVHHTLTDGEAGVQLAMAFLDLERDALQPADPTQDEADAAAEAAADVRDADTKAADAVRDVLVGGLRLPLGVLQQVKELLADPTQIPDATSAAAGTLQNLLGQLRPPDSVVSPLWAQRSTRRRLDHCSAPLDAVKQVATKLGGTLNTAFVTIAAEAAGAYHRDLGAPVESLRTSMAVSTRADGSGPNAFSLVRLAVPTAEMPFEDRFRMVGDALAAAADSPSPSFDALAALAAPLPMAVISRIARQQTRTVDFATSNVRGATMPVYIAGARVLHNVPIGPLAGVALNLTLLSYDGALDMGLHTDAAAVTEPEVLKGHVDAAVNELRTLTARRA